MATTSPRAAALLATAALVVLALPAAAGTGQVVIVNNDGAGEGFNDPSARTPVTGNPGTTLGQQRLNVFLAAAGVWERIIETDVDVRVLSQMNPLTCSPGSGVLGSAGPIEVFRDFAGAPEAATWYHVALANSRAGMDLSPGTDDINATFNSDIGVNPNCLTGLDWWYGIGAPPPANTIDFFTTVLHEIGHGLGFSTFVNGANGNLFLGFEDGYMKHLEDHSLGLRWPQMSSAQRAASVIDTGDLHWVGPRALTNSGGFTAGTHASGHIRMYAPNPRQPGSSTSHWDTAVAPNELMEPFLNDDALDLASYFLLEDVGWRLQQVFRDGVEANGTRFWDNAVPAHDP
jgi:hypothetical protein